MNTGVLMKQDTDDCPKSANTPPVGHTHGHGVPPLQTQNFLKLFFKTATLPMDGSVNKDGGLNKVCHWVDKEG